MKARDLGWLTLVAFAGCAGGTPEAQTAEGSDRGGTGAEGAVGKDSYCLDGTCFDCGESFCMMGFYCDETMPGGPGCSAVPECGSESSCRCLEDALGAACSCADRDGGAYVRCD